MRRFVLLVSLLSSTALFAQWEQPQNRLDKLQMAANPVIVEFRDPPLCERHAIAAKAAKAEYEAMFRRFRSDVSSSNISYEYYELFNGVALTASPVQIAAIRQLSYVKSIQPDMPVHALGAAPPANIKKIRADQVWSTLGSRGRGVTVAIIDTGIDYNHPALGGGFGPGHKVIGGYNFVSKNNDPMDDNLHGTHVAGIIAGNSDELLGVAPEASLLAFKVLDSHGSGMTSDVLAGIERAADPNNDGDFSDHADVANLSLGGIGNPDDAQSQAIDRGTALGVVYCIAAGNSGSGFHTIASPGNARTAITVGATDNNDVVAFFSSRGPNTKNAALKPDVLAPGVSVVSSVPGGKYAALSGTSMATPHVAGVAALVKSLHPEWTADQIKSAIITSASVLNLEGMIQGGGRVDALSAASTSTLVSPASISLGEDRLPQTTWTALSTLHITNNGNQAATYTIGTPLTTAVSILVDPARTTLDPGASVDVSLTYTATNKFLVPGNSLAFGGLITITNNVTPEVTRVPWAAVRAARVLLNYDKFLPVVQFIDRTAPAPTVGLPIDGSTEEAFLAGGNYDVLVVSEELDIPALLNSGTFKDSDLRLHYLEAVPIADDRSIAVNSSAASHAITLNAQNENGQPLVTTNYDGYASTGRIVLPAGTKMQSVILGAYPARLWHVTDMSEKLLLEELNYDFVSPRFYIIQHSPLNGVNADATLTAGGSELKRASISAALAPSSQGDQRVVLFVMPIVPPNDAQGPLGLTLHPTSALFNMTLFLGSDTDTSYSMSTALLSITDGVTRFNTPQIRILNGSIIVPINGTQIQPWSYTGDTLLFGNGLHFPRQVLLPVATAKPLLFADFYGQLGDLRLAERTTTTTTVYAGDAIQTSDTSFPVTLDLTQRGPYTIVSIDRSSLAPGIPRTSTLTSTIDSARPDFTPPMLTTMMLFDGEGRIATHLDSHGSGAIVFGAGDFTYGINGTGAYQPIAGDQTKAFYRRSGSQTWNPLTLAQLGEDAQSGIVYRADLKDAADADNVLIDLRFDVADASGNTTSFVMEPAFAVGRDSFFGRRSPHR
jgi:subtilisin family serine protease